MGCVLGSLACCFGTTACHLCCSCVPSCKSSTSARVGFALILFCGALACSILLAPGLRDELRKIPFLCDDDIFPDGADATSIALACDKIVGYEAVYRICFALTCFFFLHAILMLAVRSSKDPRAKYQNGFWAVKLAILGGFITGAFFIPYGEAEEIGFAKVWMWIGMTGAVLFLLYQLIQLIDSMHSWNENWTRRADDCRNGRNRWNFMIALFSLLFYGLIVTAVVFLFMYYGKEGCVEHRFFIGLHLALTLIVSIISELNVVKRRLPASGMLPSSAVSLYALYVTWNGMSNNPDRYCNPNIMRHLFANITPTNATAPGMDVETTPTSGIDPVAVLGLVIWFISLCASCFRSNNAESNFIGGASGSKAERVVSYGECDGANKEKYGQNVWDDEEDGVAYSYSRFHLMMMFSSLYIMMTLTNWFKLSPDLTSLNTNLSAMWVKVSTGWAVFFLYTWTLVAPLICPHRFE